MPVAPASTSPQVTHAALFAGFLEVGMSGFGGVLPWAKRMIVDQRRWLNEREFVEALGLCQVLPGPNIVNVAVCLGSRFRGPTGALAALAGLMLAPVGIVLLLAKFYGEYRHAPAVHGALLGISAAAAGLVIATGVKLAAPYRGSARAALFIIGTFVAIGVCRYPLTWVLLVVGPLSVVAAWRAAP